MVIQCFFQKFNRSDGSLKCMLKNKRENGNLNMRLNRNCEMKWETIGIDSSVSAAATADFCCGFSDF